MATLEVSRDSARNIEGWDPEDKAHWNSSVAWSTLWITTFNLVLGFMTWYLVSAIAPKLNGIGFGLSQSQMFWLAAMPGLAGGFLRLIWMFLPPIMGTRRMVAFSTASLLIPLIGWVFALQNTNTPYSVLMLLAFLSGIGGGVFSGYMPSTSYFFPKSKQGTALGLQAGIGNFGVSLVQFIVPLVIGFGMIGAMNEFQAVDANKNKVGAPKEMWLQNGATLLIPFVIVGAIVAWFMLKSVPIRANVKQQMDIFSNKHTWIMTLEYLLTFGVFSGLAGSFGLLLKSLYGDGAVALAFLGALVGSVARIVWGPFCDKLGGGIWTVVSGIGIAVFSLVLAIQLMGGKPAEGMFVTLMLLIFTFAGVGNAATFKQMPQIFPPRQAGGVIGWTAAIAAFGPFLFNVSFSAFPYAAVFFFVAVFAVVCAVLAWYYYARKNAEAKS